MTSLEWWLGLRESFFAAGLSFQPFAASWININQIVVIYICISHTYICMYIRIYIFPYYSGDIPMIFPWLLVKSHLFPPVFSTFSGQATLSWLRGQGYTEIVVVGAVGRCLPGVLTYCWISDFWMTLEDFWITLDIQLNRNPAESHFGLLDDYTVGWVKTDQINPFLHSTATTKSSSK